MNNRNLVSFTLPRRTFPEGPFQRSDLDSLSAREINEIPVTRENFAQLAYYADPIPAALIRSAIGSFSISKQAFLDDMPDVLHRFGEWRNCNEQGVKTLCENYPIILSPNGYARVYIPPVYWIDEALGSVVRSGPFVFWPGSSTYRVNDLSNQVLLSAAAGQGECTRWRRMVHPHIDEGRVCLGTEHTTYINLLAAGDLYGLAEVFERLIQHYNPASPYRRFHQQFEGTTSIDAERERRIVILRDGSDLWATTRTFYEGTQSTETHEWKLGPICLHLFESEIEVMNNVDANRITAWLIDIIRGQGLNFAEGEETDARESLGDEWYEFLDRILPPGETKTERLANAGIRVTPGFHQANTPMDAIYTPILKEQTLDLSDLELPNPNETGEADDNETSSEEEAENGGTAEAESAHPEPVF